MEGAEVAILYHANDTDAEDTKKMVKEIGSQLRRGQAHVACN